MLTSIIRRIVRQLIYKSKSIRRSLFPERSVRIVDGFTDLLKVNGLNICYNRWIPSQYNPRLRNILLAIESPAVINHMQWLKPDMKFEAEISFANFYQLPNYYCCRELYVGSDHFVKLQAAEKYLRKNRGVSLIYSRQKHLVGHALRHEVAASPSVTSRLDLFGSGTGSWLSEKIDSLAEYQFQVVIENGKHPEYVSEKFFDCLKTLTIPIYWGGDEAVQKLGFDSRGYYSFGTTGELAHILERDANSETYERMRPFAMKNLHRLIELRNESRFQMILGIYRPGYLRTPESYLKGQPDLLSLAFDAMLRECQSL